MNTEIETAAELIRIANAAVPVEPRGAPAGQPLVAPTSNVR
jgi:hypothetical protein